MDNRLLITTYIDTYLFPPEYNWQSYYFAERSAERWSAFNILEAVIQQPEVSPYILIEDIIKTYKDASESTEDRETNFIFSVAEETAIDILTTLKRENRYEQTTAANVSKKS